MPMHVQLNERLYKEAERRAAEAGFSSVDAYVADVISQDLIEDDLGESPHIEHLLTPKRIAEIDAAIADVDAGNFLTEEEMEAYYKQVRGEWEQRNNSR